MPKYLIFVARARPARLELQASLSRLPRGGKRGNAPVRAIHPRARLAPIIAPGPAGHCGDRATIAVKIGCEAFVSCESLEKSAEAAYLGTELGLESQTVPRKPRHFWKSGVVALATLSLALPPALAAMSRADRIRETSLSDALLGQFTPASGDPRLIARYAQVSADARRNFSFTPAVTDENRKNRAITVVIRARDDASNAARAALLGTNRKAPVTIAPVAYNLGASVGLEKFVTPTLPRGVDLRNLPQAQAPERGERKSRFATRMLTRPSEPAGATDRVTSPGDDQTVDVVSSYRLTKNLDVTAGVRYRTDDGVQPLTDARRDSQAVYVGTAFRF
jgi:hypothetical protein